MLLRLFTKPYPSDRVPASKRSLDLVLAVGGLTLLWPLFAAIAVWIAIDSRGPIFFRQVRVGRGGRLFTLYKFRTMVDRPVGDGPLVTAGNDARISRAGKVLRRSKLDELPQLLNVLKGEMSLVGPRPEVPRYVSDRHADWPIVLSVLPGMTDFASLQFFNEGDLLAASDDPEQFYCQHVLPRKLRLNRQYVERACLALDIQLIGRTLGKLLAIAWARRLRLPSIRIAGH